MEISPLHAAIGNCPKCQSTARDKWLDVTKPPNFCPFPIAMSYSRCRSEISTLALQNQRLVL